MHKQTETFSQDLQVGKELNQDASQSDSSQALFVSLTAIKYMHCCLLDRNNEETILKQLILMET